jgi:CHAD domain-containing protein
VLKQPSPALGKHARTARKRVKKVQSLLGDRHDTVVARSVLRRLGAQAQVEGGNGFTFGVLRATEHATAHALEQQVPTAWARGENACRT